jgi:hypothetical protein
LRPGRFAAARFVVARVRVDFAGVTGFAAFFDCAEVARLPPERLAVAVVLRLTCREVFFFDREDVVAMESVRQVVE